MGGEVSSLDLSPSLQLKPEEIEKARREPRKIRPIDTPLLWFLLPLLHADVAYIVLSYVVTIQFKLFKSVGRHGAAAGHMKSPSGVCVFDEEIYVADNGCNRLQVFHATTGAFLRAKSGFQKAYNNPRKVALIQGQLFVVFGRAVQVLRPADLSHLETWLIGQKSLRFLRTTTATPI
jgi:hypothetical protein